MLLVLSIVYCSWVHAIKPIQLHAIYIVLQFNKTHSFLHLLYLVEKFCFQKQQKQ